MKRIVVIAILALCFPFLIGSKHIGPAYDTRTYDALDAFAVDYAKKHNLIFLNSGVGILADSKAGTWAISLVSRQKLTLEEARLLAMDLSFQLLYKVFHDPVFTKHCNVRKRAMKEEYVAFRLAFWDQNVDRPLYPYLAQIRLVDGHLYYHYADPETQALQEPIIEPLNLSNYR